MDENSTPDENIFINQSDGLTHHDPLSLNDPDSDIELNDDIDSDSFDDLPTSLIVTNIHSDVFTNDDLKLEMEELFRFFSERATFQWFKSFRRMRVNFDTGIAAANARIQLHRYTFGKSTITCYFTQPVTPAAHKYLKPPAPFRQFLISPPASPPAGWEPREEGEPLVNHDLLAALANLTPGESHELHPQTPDHPAIIVHTALIPTVDALPDSASDDLAAMKSRIPQTKCPERAS